MADTATPTPPPAPSAPPPPPGKGFDLGFEIPRNFDEAKKLVIDSQLWRSVFRGGVWKDTPRDRASHIIGNVWLHLHPIRVRKRALEWTYTWGLGGISFMLFLILTVTGVLLMFYYRPTVDLAYRDMKDLEFAVSLGMFMRNAHRWAAQAMVVFVILHMARVFYTGAYKKPREFNWGIGVLLLSLTLFLSFTGYLLPWDQLAIWAVTVGTNMAGATPGLGNEGPFSALLGMRINNDVRYVLLGGTVVGENTLLRFYVMHCVAVPLVVGVLLILHFWRIRKDSFSAAPYVANEEKIEVWPHLVKREYLAAAGCCLAIFIWSVLQNAPLELEANPNITPNPSKAPWYFVGLQELLVYFDPWIAGVVLPNMIIVGLMAVPYIDPSPKGVGYYSFKERPFANSMFTLGMVMWFGLIYIGYYCRGPNFAWYWPWESWLMQKPPDPPTWNVFGPGGGDVPFTVKNAMEIIAGKMKSLPRGMVPDLFPLWAGVLVLVGGGAAGIVAPKLLNRDLPKHAVSFGSLAAFAVLAAIGMAFGMGWVKGLFLIIFGWLSFYYGFILPQRHIRGMDWTRYTVTMILVLSTIGVLVKMGARLVLDVKYILAWPDFNLNI